MISTCIKPEFAKQEYLTTMSQDTMIPGEETYNENFFTKLNKFCSLTMIPSLFFAFTIDPKLDYGDLFAMFLQREDVVRQFFPCLLRIFFRAFACSFGSGG